jgi:hypothetical protein
MAADTVNVALPRATYRKLEQAARRAGLDPATLLRQMVDETVETRSAHDVAQRFYGAAPGAPPDVSDRLDAHLDGYGQ